MDSIQEIIAAVLAIVAAVSTLVARYQETSPELSFLARIFKVGDLTQIFDSTRALSDVPEDIDFDDGNDFDASVSEE